MAEHASSGVSTEVVARCKEIAQRCEEYFERDVQGSQFEDECALLRKNIERSTKKQEERNIEECTYLNFMNSSRIANNLFLLV